MKNAQLPMKNARTSSLILPSTAAWGLGIAIAVAPQVLQRSAGPSQPPGIMRTLQLDASGPFVLVVLLAVLPIIAALIGRLIAQIALRRGIRSWAVAAISTSFVLGLWSAFIKPSSPGTVVIAPLLVAAGILVAGRSAARFSRRDLILVPVWIAAYLAVFDLWTSGGFLRAIWISAALVLAVRLVVARSAEREWPADNFVFAPLAFFFLLREVPLHRMAAAGIALAIILGSPFVAARIRWPNRRQVAAFVILPLAVGAYAHVTALAAGEGHHRVSLFEDGHPLMPASEMLRGEVLYRDVTPGHGALTDGLVDYLGLRLFDENLGGALDFRALLATLTPIALYFLVLAATGSPEVGFLGVLLTGVFLRNSPLILRPAFALLAVACAIAAVRGRSLRWMAVAGVLLVPAFLSSIDFAVYAAAAVVMAVFAFSGMWRRRLRAAACGLVGFTAAAIPVLMVLAYYGIVSAFFRVTFGEVLRLGPAYTQPFALANVPPHASTFPESIRLLFDPMTQGYLLWCVVALIVAVLLAREAPRIRPRDAALILIGTFTLATGISFAERRHEYFDFVLPAFFLTGTFLLWRWKTPLARAFAFVATAALVVLASPTITLSVLAILRITAGPPPQWGEFTELSRARGGLLERSTFPKLQAVNRFVSTLGPEETYFDFANLPLLYFLVDKPSPIRQYEVPHFQAEQLQREVVERLERDRSVRAALISLSLDTINSIDGIPNAERVPLVWRYLQENFEPAFDEEGVVFWRRKGR
jgi:hypothetical protein